MAHLWQCKCLRGYVPRGQGRLRVLPGAQGVCNWAVCLSDEGTENRRHRALLNVCLEKFTVMPTLLSPLAMLPLSSLISTNAECQVLPKSPTLSTHVKHRETKLSVLNQA